MASCSTNPIRLKSFESHIVASNTQQYLKGVNYFKYDFEMLSDAK